MEIANPPPTNNPHILPTAFRARVVQELNELQAISAYIDSRLKSINRFLSGFTQQPNEIDVDDLEPNDESVDTPLVSPFLDSDDDPDDGEVLNELEEYEGLESTGKNLVAIVQDVYVFVESFTYITDFVILEYIGDFILSKMAEVVMGKPFRKITQLEYDCAKGLMSFTRIFDNYTFQMSRTIPRNAYEKNKFMYKNCLNLGPEYQVDESMKEWLIRGHVSLHEVTKFFKENEKKILLGDGDSISIYPDGVVIFDEKKLGNSLEVSLDDSWRTI
ncbi:hypothetical protein Tco_1058552 [Tanacetum coccineum]|uniref:Uncharacterized protein n=1 Tax=Tanacetum coccineum TaxID=301880 RepID=A0ABQ5HA24_9ASTR